MHPEVLETTYETMKNFYGNASSIHGFGREARHLLDDARSVFAKSIGAKQSEIVITSGGTESDNTAVIETALSRESMGKHLITSKVEHHAILEPMEYLESLGFEVTYLPVDEFGQVDPELVQSAIRPDTTLVSIMYGNNEVGTLMNIAEIGAIVAETESYFHTDAVQAYGLEEIDVKRSQIDLLSVSAHKINGPKGVGFLYVSEAIHLPSFMRGGEQETKRRAGTENIPAIAGFKKAVEIMQAEKVQRKEAYNTLKQQVVSELTEAGIDFEVNGASENGLAHVLSLWIKEIPSDQLLMNLDLMGIAISAGSACTAGNIEPSHVLTAMYGENNPRVSQSVRVSFGLGTEPQMIHELVEKLVIVVNRLKK